MLTSLLPSRRYSSYAILFIGVLAASACSSTLPDATKTTSVNRNKVDVAYSAPNLSRVPKPHGPASVMKKVPPYKATQTAYFGTAPHICSPSGFGQKSTCSLRKFKGMDS